MLAGRTAAADDELEAVPVEWCRIAPHTLRDMRRAPLPRWGGDVVVDAATDSLRGLLLALPAWHVAEPGTLAPIDPVIVPYKALVIHLEKTFFEKLANQGRMWAGARAHLRAALAARAPGRRSGVRPLGPAPVGSRVMRASRPAVFESILNFQDAKSQARTRHARA